MEVGEGEELGMVMGGWPVGIMPKSWGRDWGCSCGCEAIVRGGKFRMSCRRGYCSESEK